MNVQAELSKKTGIPKSTLSGYFAQRSTPNAGNLGKTSAALILIRAILILDIDMTLIMKLMTLKKLPELRKNNRHIF